MTVQVVEAAGASWRKRVKKRMKLWMRLWTVIFRTRFIIFEILDDFELGIYIAVLQENKPRGYASLRKDKFDMFLLF